VLLDCSYFAAMLSIVNSELSKLVADSYSFARGIKFYAG